MALQMKCHSSERRPTSSPDAGFIFVPYGHSNCDKLSPRSRIEDDISPFPSRIERYFMLACFDNESGIDFALISPETYSYDQRAMNTNEHVERVCLKILSLFQIWVCLNHISNDCCRNMHRKCFLYAQCSERRPNYQMVHVWPSYLQTTVSIAICHWTNIFFSTKNCKQGCSMHSCTPIHDANKSSLIPSIDALNITYQWLIILCCTASILLGCTFDLIINQKSINMMWIFA